MGLAHSNLPQKMPLWHHPLQPEVGFSFLGSIFIFSSFFFQVCCSVKTKQPQHPVAQGSPVHPHTLCRSASGCLL